MPHKNNTAAINRREAERVIPERGAPVRVHINGTDFIEVTDAIDISEGGVRISVKHRFAGCHVDQPASIIVFLPAPISRHFSTHGRIRHVLDDSFGIQFVGLNPADLKLLRQYVRLRSGAAAPVVGMLDNLRRLFGLA